MMMGNTLRNLAAPLLSMVRDALAQEENEKTYEPTPLRAMREITNTESFGSILPYTAFHEAEALFVLDTGERDTKTRGQALGFTSFPVDQPKVVGVDKNDVFVADTGLAE